MLIILPLTGLIHFYEISPATGLSWLTLPFSRAVPCINYIAPHGADLLMVHLPLADVRVVPVIH